MTSNSNNSSIGITIVLILRLIFNLQVGNSSDLFASYMSKFKKIDFVVIINYHALTSGSFDSTRNQGLKVPLINLRLIFEYLKTLSSHLGSNGAESRKGRH